MIFCKNCWSLLSSDTPNGNCTLCGTLLHVMRSVPNCLIDLYDVPTPQSMLIERRIDLSMPIVCRYRKFVCSDFKLYKRVQIEYR